MSELIEVELLTGKQLLLIEPNMQAASVTQPSWEESEGLNRSGLNIRYSPANKGLFFNWDNFSLPGYSLNNNAVGYAGSNALASRHPTRLLQPI